MGMSRRTGLVIVTVACCACWALAAPQKPAKRPPLPENLALKAKITANSEYSGNYLAKFVADGQIPAPGSSADVNLAWCVQGNTHKHNGELTFQWPKPVTIAEIVYYGRTAWFAEECWKDYEVYLDGSPQPVAKGQFERGHGPQRIKLPKPAQAAKLVLRFTRSYGGFNPGASEVQVFAEGPADGALDKFVKLPDGQPSPEVVQAPLSIEESAELRKDVLSGKLGFTRLVLIQRHVLNPTHVYTQHVEGFRPGGGLFVLDLEEPGGKLTQLVASDQGQILDCDVSHDGKEILFSWRKTPKDGYHLFRINVDPGAPGGLTQITDGPWHDYNACWLPDGDIAFLCTRKPQFAYCWISPVGTIHRVDRNGNHLKQLSANYLNDFTPYVLDNGRIIYGRWEYVDRPAIPIQSLWTLNPDGTNLAVFFGNRVLSPATFIEPRNIPGTGKVLCILTAHNGPCRGGIGIIDPVHGVNAQESIRNLTPEINIGQVGRGDGNHVRGPYESPCPIDQRYFLVSREGTILVRDYDGTAQAVVARPRDGMGFYNPQPIRPRPRPPVFQSSLPPDAEPWATLYLQDVYNGLEPQVQRGEVRAICVVQELGKGVRASLSQRAFGFQFPVISCGATYAGKKVWGYVPVAQDGSASFKVPAGVPIYFMAIDAQGRAVQRMRSFTHLMPGEVQGCIGCHEPRDQASRAHRPSALSGQVQDLQPPEWGLKGFDYITIVQPALDKYCVRCHGGIDPPNGVDLSGDRTDFFCMSYETLARGRKGGQDGWDNPYTSWIPSYNGHEANILQITPKAWGSPHSKLAEIILSGHPDKNGQVRFRMDAVSRQRVFAWIDLNVPYYGTSETAYPDLPGCRRLVPRDLEGALADVANRRCAQCHGGGRIPRKVWLRITNPQMNSFLLAPLSRAGGGTQKCGKVIFESTDDGDYQKILKTFEPLLKQIKEKPRMDMPGAKPCPTIDRSCQ